MLIKEVCNITKLTKKAISYYEEKKLISPNVLENGYRDYNANDVEKLKKITILRKLGLGIDEIKIALSDKKGHELQKLSIRRQLNLEREKAKQDLLDKLSTNQNWNEISADLKIIEQTETIIEKLFSAFPGYYGRFICLHFSRFLNEPIITSDEQKAYDEIVNFLDNTPKLEFPKALQEFLIESTKHITIQNIRKINENTKKSIENPEEFLSKNKKILNQYLENKKSDEYKNSPAYKIQTMIKNFNSTNGYNDIFIPAMRRLSRSYAQYYSQLEVANGKLLLAYPELENFSD